MSWSKTIFIMGFIGLFGTTGANLPFLKYGDYARAANRLMDFQKLPSKDYSVLKHNLTFYLKNYISPSELNLWRKLQKEEFLGKILQKNFWSDKLERDLSLAYSDAEFYEYLSSISGELKVFLRYLRFMNLEHKALKLYLYGGMAKGRFGGKSSLDLLVESEDSGLIERLGSGIYSKGNAEFQGNIELATTRFGAKYILTPLIEVQPQDLLDLGSLYTQILKKMGFELMSKKGRLKIRLASSLQRYHLEFNPIEDRVYYLSHKSFRLGQEIVGSHGNIGPQGGSSVGGDPSELRLRIQKLVDDFEEVGADLRLIQAQSNGPRLDRIKSVISKPSYSRLANHRSSKLQGTVKSWSDTLSQWLNLVD
jgi:hypothetical protein